MDTQLSAIRPVREAGRRHAAFLRSDPGIRHNEPVPRLLPPSPKRVRSARALGLRPRAGALTLAGVALGLTALLELVPHGVGWLSDQLGSVARGSVTGVSWDRAAWSGVGLLLLLVGLTIPVVIMAPRRRARRSFDVGPEIETIPVGFMVGLVVVAIVVITASSQAAIAGAARSVDASAGALASVWLAWIRRGLLALAAAALGVGVIERLLSARQLWQGLHQTQAQARRERRSG
jgi:hypothetical protein